MEPLGLRLAWCRYPDPSDPRQAWTVPSGVQQLAQQGFDLVALGGLAIQLGHPIQHHLLLDRWIVRKMLGVDSHVSKSSPSVYSLTHYVTGKNEQR